MIISHSTADRWEELPGVKVQSQDTPSAVGKVTDYSTKVLCQEGKLCCWHQNTSLEFHFLLF